MIDEKVKYDMQYDFMPLYELKESQIDRIIEMAWEDRTPFDAITFQFNLSNKT